jgi:hypothetical protein
MKEIPCTYFCSASCLLQFLAVGLYFIALHQDSFERIAPENSTRCLHALVGWNVESFDDQSYGEYSGAHRCGSAITFERNGNDQILLLEDQSQLCLENYAQFKRAYELASHGAIVSTLTPILYGVARWGKQYFFGIAFLVWLASTLLVGFAHQTLLDINLTTADAPVNSSIVCAGTYKRNDHAIRLWIAGIVLSLGIPLHILFDVCWLCMRASSEVTELEHDLDINAASSDPLLPEVSTKMHAHGEEFEEDGRAALPSYEEVTRGTLGESVV